MIYGLYRGLHGGSVRLVYELYEPLSKLLVSPLITPILVLYIIPYITPFQEFRLWIIWGL